MKIAYLYDAVYPYTVGGVERRIYELSRRLTARGHEVHIFGMHSWEGERDLELDGVYYHGICPRMPLYREGRRSIWQAARFGVHSFLPFLRDGFDVIDCQNFPYFSCLAARTGSLLRLSPLVITWHEFWEDYWNEYLGWAGTGGRWMERLCTGLTPHNVAVSGLTQRALSQHFRKDIPVIPNGITLREIQSARPSPITSDLVFAGRLIREKRADLLLDAVKLLKQENPDLRYVVIGDGPERGALEARSRNLGLSDNVLFTGFLPDPAGAWSYFLSSKVFVLPSIREGFGMSALEALACGLPVVTIDHPRNATKALLTPDTGRVCKEDACALTIAIRECLEQSAEMKGACIARARGYDWDRIVGEMERFYHDVAGYD